MPGPLRSCHHPPPHSLSVPFEKTRSAASGGCCLWSLKLLDHASLPRGKDGTLSSCSWRASSCGSWGPSGLTSLGEHENTGPGACALCSSRLAEAVGDTRAGPCWRLLLCSCGLLPTQLRGRPGPRDPRSLALRSYHLHGVFLRIRDSVPQLLPR